MNVIRLLLPLLISTLLISIVMWFFLKVINIEFSHLLLPGWHTTDLEGNSLFKTVLIFAIIISVISNLIYLFVISIIEKRNKNIY
jgi:hypothetical protein